MKSKKLLLALAASAGIFSASAHASLTAFQSYTGHVGVSTDGWGSLSQSGVITANVPAGSTVIAAYLYTSTFSNPTLAGVGGTLAGDAVNYAVNLGSPGYLNAARADVTSIIKPLVDGGVGGVYNFNITETDASQDGSALVLVYSNPALGISTVGILDGFSAQSGDDTAINFASPLDPSAPGFTAEMRLGIGYSCCGQRSSVSVNGTTITEEAGNNDDGDIVSNGSLITVGGDDDAYSPFLPVYTDDHERYNLVPYITAGDTLSLIHI